VAPHGPRHVEHAELFGTKGREDYMVPRVPRERITAALQLEGDPSLNRNTNWLTGSVAWDPAVTVPCTYWHNALVC